jgi:hypothetical protein
LPLSDTRNRRNCFFVGSRSLFSCARTFANVRFPRFDANGLTDVNVSKPNPTLKKRAAPSDATQTIRAAVRISHPKPNVQEPRETFRPTPRPLLAKSRSFSATQTV